MAWSNVKLNSIAVQDDLDDNTYEYVRRYLALTSFMGGILPSPYDPRHLILRQTLSPITGTTDVQASIDTVQLGIHQRLQTKRGPIGKRRIVDYMTLDASTTYFPYAQRDNFGTPWGQAMYNWQWYVGDRTSIRFGGMVRLLQTGGQHALEQQHDDGLQPERAQYHHVGGNYHPAAQGQYVFRLFDHRHRADQDVGGQRVGQLLAIPKWFGTYSTSYDFGDAILLGSTVLIHSNRGRLPDHGRTCGRPAARQLQFCASNHSTFEPGHAIGRELGRGPV